MHVLNAHGMQNMCHFLSFKTILVMVHASKIHMANNTDQSIEKYGSGTASWHAQLPTVSVW